MSGAVPFTVPTGAAMRVIAGFMVGALIPITWWIVYSWRSPYLNKRKQYD